MKLIATICDCGHVVHAGGEPERTSYEIDIPDDKLPRALLDYVKQKQAEDKGTWCYKSVTFSILMGSDSA